MLTSDQLGIVKQRACGVQLLGAEGEGVDIRIGVGPPPVLEVGIQHGHQVFPHGLCREALRLVVGQSQLGVFPLGELPLGVAVHFHQRSNVDILGQLEAQGLEQLDVEGQAGQPLVAPDYMGGAHQVVVHGVGEVIGGNAVGFQQHMVHIVFRNGQLALYQVVEFELVLNGARRAEAEHPGIASGQLAPGFPPCCRSRQMA